MKIAVEGCAHGELEKIYECIEIIQRREDINVDLLVCCGDFQSVRNHEDLRAMAVPQKYQHMCSFYKYYSGEKTAPILTIFIGGNHEASNYLQELPYGGWVAPNIYYLGRAGVIKYGDLRIGGLSGIFKGHDYLQGHWECLPYSQNSLRTVYHVRSLELYRLNQMMEKVHVMLSHDWPRGITDYGDVKKLLKRKPFFREEVESNRLGNEPTMRLLRSMKPDYWFAAHLHCQFAALVKHDDQTETKFLALDKCLPKRQHLQIVDIPSEYDGDMCLKYDAEWLAILKNTNHLLTVNNVDNHLPGPGGNERYNFTPSEDEKANIVRLLGSLIIEPTSFVRTASVFDPRAKKVAPTVPILNPQTVNLCEKLGIDDPVQVVMARTGRAMKLPYERRNPQDDITSWQQKEAQRPVVQTPIKAPRQSPCLPAPITPNEGEKTLPLEDSLQTETSSMSDSFGSNLFYECRTPMSAGSETTIPTYIPTPVGTSKQSICLPAPITPTEGEKSLPLEDSLQKVTTSDSFDSSTFSECRTPTSSGAKKTMKRRNMSIYTNSDPDENVSTDSSSMMESESPKTNKLAFRSNASCE